MLHESVPYTLNFISRLLPPNWPILDVAVKALIETVQMSLWGTTIGAVLSLPIAFLSDHNLTPKWIRWIANLLQNGVRSVPSIVLGLIPRLKGLDRGILHQSTRLQSDQRLYRYTLRRGFIVPGE